MEIFIKSLKDRPIFDVKIQYLQYRLPKFYFDKIFFTYQNIALPNEPRPQARLVYSLSKRCKKMGQTIQFAP